MKRLIFIALAVTLALSMVWVPSIAAVEPVPVEIIKTIPPGGPPETFTFQGWRDMNNNGEVDAGDIDLGTVDITGAGTGMLYSPYGGPCIVREILGPGSAYEQQPDQIAQAGCEPVIFENIRKQEDGQLVILKEDGSGNALAGACFEIAPDPKTGTGVMTLCDNGANDEYPADGILGVTGCILGLVCNVTETVVPPGYEGAAPQAVTISATLTVTFVNTEEKCELTIYKVDGSGEPLAGACFTITPNPKTGTDSLVLCDNDANDECPADGVFCLSELICGLTVTVEETTVPDGYQGAAPQAVTIGETVELTFVNTERTPSCGTVCAAQTAPGEYLFGGDQSNWFTYITYNKGDGAAGSPKPYPIYTGATTLCGTLYVYDDGTHIFVNYVLTDIDTCTLGGLSEYHLQVNDTLADLKKKIVNNGGNPVPGKCTYKGTLDPMASETGWIECDSRKDDISGWSNPIHIFAHGVGCYYCP